jgi:hypothetical protein
MSSMNRQSRYFGHEDWHDRGNVTLEQAAVDHYKEAIPSVHAALIEVAIEVRDANNPDQVWVLKVTPKVTYEVSGLRGGDV